MIRRFNGFENRLLTLVGPTVPVVFWFLLKVILGVLAIPIAVLGYGVYWIYRLVVYLHNFGERSLTAIAAFWNPERN